MNEVLDSLVVYTLENGSLTSAATVASMICWVTMPNSLCLSFSDIRDVLIVSQDKIFLAIHVVIGKRELYLLILPSAVSEVCGAVYANSLLATLLARNHLRESRKSTGQHALPLFSSGFDSAKRSPNRFTFARHSVGSVPALSEQIVDIVY
jgi:hypothetical protein